MRSFYILKQKRIYWEKSFLSEDFSEDVKNHNMLNSYSLKAE